jgi:hypothetical protein
VERNKAMDFSKEETEAVKFLVEEKLAKLEDYHYKYGHDSKKESNNYC